VKNFFTHKSGLDCCFIHKLINVLKITDWDPSYFGLIAVAWISDTIFKVDKRPSPTEMTHPVKIVIAHNFLIFPMVCQRLGRLVLTLSPPNPTPRDLPRGPPHFAFRQTTGRLMIAERSR
jgi:hypothetical protein